MTTLVIFIFSRRCLKAVRKIVGGNRSGRITRSRFVRYFKPYLSRRHICGRPARRCSRRQLRRTIRTVTKGLTKLYCALRRQRGYSVAKFLNRSFNRSQKGGYLVKGTFSYGLSNILRIKKVRGTTRLRRQLRRLR